MFLKPLVLRRIRSLFGESLITQEDEAAYQRQRDLLGPAFRSDYVRSLTPVFARKGREAVKVILQLSEGGAAEVEVQDIMRRITLDVIGLTGFKVRDLSSWDSDSKPSASQTKPLWPAVRFRGAPAGPGPGQGGVRPGHHQSLGRRPGDRSHAHHGPARPAKPASRHGTARP